MHSQEHAVKTHTCTLSFFFFFFFSVFNCISLLLSLLHFSAWWVLECHYNFCYQKQTAGLDWGVHARPPVFHAESAAACRVLFWLLLGGFSSAPFNKWSGVFLKDRFIDRAPAARAQPAHVVLFLNGNPFSLCILTLQSLSLGLCVNEYDFMSRGKFDPFTKMHRQTAQVNDIIELMSYTPLSAVHSYGQPEAWRLSASYTGYCMFDESLEGSFR